MPIATTHTGSLPRPPDLTSMLIEHQEGHTVPNIEARFDQAVSDIVAVQLAIGIDVVNDGEQTKTGYSTYVQERLSGFEGEAASRPAANDLQGHADFAELAVKLRGRPSPRLPPCTGPITLTDPGAVHRDVDRLRAGALGAPDDVGLFMSAASPGLIAMFFGNEYYSTREQFLHAIADAMRPEYQAIIEAGFVLQLDCPDFAMSHNSVFQHLDLPAFRHEVALGIEALNYATEGLPPEQMRLHVCWGNYESPHTTDIPLADLIDLIVTASPSGLSLEGANPRHGHEWRLFEQFTLPDDKYLIPGVIDTTTNYVEHPELIAQRISNYADLVGASRVMAGTDCGFDTFIGRDRVAPSVCYSKLQALVEGARLVDGQT